VPSAKGFANVGDELDAVVLSVDTVDRKIGLSIKSLQTALEKEEMAGYMGNQSDSFSSLETCSRAG